MAYVRINDFDGKEHEFQVVNSDHDILISENCGRFKDLETIKEKWLKSALELVETEKLYNY